MAQPYLPLREELVDAKTGHARTRFALWMQAVQALLFGGDPKGAFIQWGTGSPESVVTGPVGSLFLRTNGGASTTMYVKESGTGNTGWRAV